MNEFNVETSIPKNQAKPKQTKKNNPPKFPLFAPVESAKGKETLQQLSSLVWCMIKILISKISSLYSSRELGGKHLEKKHQKSWFQLNMSA